MAGTLTISTLSDGTNSTSSTNCIQGSSKAWACWNGSDGVARASYNVSSITRVAMGKFTVNFTNAFANTNYGFSGGVGYSVSDQSAWLGGPNAVNRTTWKTTTALQVYTFYQNGTVSNSDPTDISVFVYNT